MSSTLEELGLYVAQMKPRALERALAQLGEPDVELLERASAEQLKGGWRSSPAAMAAELTKDTSTPFQRWGYIDLLSQKFVDAVEGRSKRQIWNLPARYGKTEVGSKWGPAWALDLDPSFRFALTSYGDQLAMENSTWVRDTLVEHAGLLRCELRKDRRRNDRFVTKEGGGLIAKGIGSGLTGFGADGLVVDDPFKDWAEAHSEARRLHVWNWFRSVARLRLNSAASWIIVIMTRWHEDDLTGKLLAEAADDGEEYELVRLPAIAEAPNPLSSDPALRAPDPLGRQPGEVLEPARFDLEAVLARAKALGSYLTAGMEQQRPAPEEGTDIMRGWWKLYDEPPPRFDDLLSSWDTKMKDKEAGDYVVGQVWGRTGSDFWLLDQLRGQWNVPTTKAAIVLLWVRWPKIRRHIIENAGLGPDLMQELRRAAPGYSVSEEVRSELGITEAELPRVNAVFRRGMTALLPENVKGDKRVRMRAQAGKIEAGNVHLPAHRGFTESLVDEASAFPDGAHDDQVDALSQALKRLAGGTARAKSPKGKVKTPKPGARAGGRAAAAQRTSSATVPRARSSQPAKARLRRR